MKFKFKIQKYQTDAVNAVIDCFKGQEKQDIYNYGADNQLIIHTENSEIKLTEDQLLTNIQEVQKRQGLIQSQSISDFRTYKNNKFEIDSKYTEKALKIAPYHFDIEMETGTGKTYCYIKTIYELNKKYGWTKFVIIVPSVAIREGIYKSFEMTAEHFSETYNEKAKCFIYNSGQLHNVEAFSSDTTINVMIINIQAFNSSGKDNRRIYDELDQFQSRKPIDVIKKTNPILIIDEPQKMEGDKTLVSLQEFNSLFVLRYSATHKSQHNKIYRLDAVDAYNQKLVKKISVKGITVKGNAGNIGYLYLESIEISKKAPVARIEFEKKQKSGIKRVTRNFNKSDNLYEISGNMEQYKDIFITEITNENVEFSDGTTLQTGEAINDSNEKTLRRIQIREAIKSHFEKEQSLFNKGIKVLTLFFIDEVAKYRIYDDNGDASNGEYATIFEEEYENYINNLDKGSLSEEYNNYLNSTTASKIHNGYFSIDNKGKVVNPKRNREKETNDVTAYDLILKDKERLLSLEEPTKFIFSHSALREGWDNPNIFVICTLKHSDNTISRRQEIGRGLRISVNKDGIRQDEPLTVHKTNVLSVVTSESYQDFVSGLQTEISNDLSERPRKANKEYFIGKPINDDISIDETIATKIYRYLVRNDYTDDNDEITQKYYDDKRNQILVELPDDLIEYKEEVFKLINSVYNPYEKLQIEDERGKKVNPLNNNFKKKEFIELWNRINKKAVYKVSFESDELIGKCVKEINENLHITPIQYTLKNGEQQERLSYEKIKNKDTSIFNSKSSETKSIKSSTFSKVKYDLVQKIADNTKLTRKTVIEILEKIDVEKFNLFKLNPEDFILNVSRLINEQKATIIVGGLKYNLLEKEYDIDIFTSERNEILSNKAIETSNHNIYDYVMTDSNVEKKFVEDLEISDEVVVYTKLPKTFYIPTPLGKYSPDWAIAFKEGLVKHIYFVAETKGSMSSLQLKGIEKGKTDCAKIFFEKINQDKKNIKYDIVDSFEKLLEIVELKN